MKALNSAPRLIRRLIAETRVAQVMRWVLIFCLGYYLAEISHHAPEAVEAVQEIMQAESRK